MKVTTDGKVPKPDAPVDITASGVLVGYQGSASPAVTGLLGLGKVADPSDSTPFAYRTNSEFTKYQILGYLETEPVSSLRFEAAHADLGPYSKRHVYVLGDSL